MTTRFWSIKANIFAEAIKNVQLEWSNYFMISAVLFGGEVIQLP